MSTTEANNDALKRKSEENADGAGPEKMSKVESPPPTGSQPTKTSSKARDIRLEQNRKAARESRRRKKVMIEELQRSVIFFSRANGTLKQQNDELTRFVMQAQMQIAAIESHVGGNSTSAPTPAVPTEDKKPDAQSRASNEDQAQANAVATQALYESNGYPAAAARAAAQAMSGTDFGNKEPSKEPVAIPPAAMASPTSQQQPPLPPMQTGATMQAMANFQQAAAAAMQSAMGQMQNLPGVSIQQLAAAPAGTNAQQAYTDTMTAFAMQQAAAAAAAGMIQPGMHFFPFLTPWQQHHPIQQKAETSAETTEQDPKPQFV